MSKYLDIYIVGVGGQGVLTIAEIITEAAFRKNIPINFYPTKGMAQRGGFVKAQLRLGREAFGPSISQQGADILASMELSEALKAVRYAKPGSEFVLYGSKWEPAAVMLGKAEYPSLDKVKEIISKADSTVHFVSEDSKPLCDGKPVHDNLFLMGFMMGSTRLKEWFSLEEIRTAVSDRWPKAKLENLHALDSGIAAAN